MLFIYDVCNLVNYLKNAPNSGSLWMCLDQHNMISVCTKQSQIVCNTNRPVRENILFVCFWNLVVMVHWEERKASRKQPSCLMVKTPVGIS